MSSTASVVDNEGINNAGGVLVTAEFGAGRAEHDLREPGQEQHDRLRDHAAAHNPQALNGKGVRQPALGGVYGNLVQNNTVIGNGLRGEGAGVLMAAAGSPSGSRRTSR